MTGLRERIAEVLAKLIESRFGEMTDVPPEIKKLRREPMMLHGKPAEQTVDLMRVRTVREIVAELRAMPGIHFDNATTVREIAYRCAGAGSAAVMRLAPDVVMPVGEIRVAVEEILCDFWPEAADRPEGDDDLDHHGDTSDA